MRISGLKYIIKYLFIHFKAYFSNWTECYNINNLIIYVGTNSFFFIIDIALNINCLTNCPMDCDKMDNDPLLGLAFKSPQSGMPKIN